jgi:hypothetical protein
MWLRRVGLVAVLAATAEGSAVAASLAPSPAAMLLRKSDFPPTATYTWGNTPANVITGLKGLGIKAGGAYVAATIPVSSTKSETVSGSVFTIANSGQARKAYAAFKRDFGSRPKLSLPAFGDEQIAVYKSGSSMGELLVRRNSVVWELSIEGMGLLVIPKAKMIAELKKYAAKQKTRVAGG